MTLQKIIEVATSLKMRILGQKPTSNANTFGYHHVKIGTCNGDGGSNSGNVYVASVHGNRAVCIAVFDQNGISIPPSTSVGSSNLCTFVYIKSEDN